LKDSFPPIGSNLEDIFNEK